MGRKTREEKAITLIALIITIVVLLILAVVAINSVTGDGIIQHATNAKEDYQEAQDEEKEMLESYLSKIETGLAKPISEAKGKVLSTTSDTSVMDEYGNIIKVPAGFKITEDAENVTEGIVIEDVSAGSETVGSQFVWIPVGKVYTNVEKTEYKEITLSRYGFASGSNPKYPIGTTKIYGEEAIGGGIQELATSSDGNATAKDINGFKSSAISNGGYYIGRYEARTSNTTVRESAETELSKVTNIKENSVYNFVTQLQASSLSRSMYENKTYTSDLINSYAWDTALVFIQTFSGDGDYSRQTSLTDIFEKYGTSDDVRSNIYDMASNCHEWTTETTGYDGYPCSVRGGSFNGNNPTPYASWRAGAGVDGDVHYSFRTILYL